MLGRIMFNLIILVLCGACLWVGFKLVMRAIQAGGLAEGRKTCRHCGHRNIGVAKFCGQCGRDLS